MTIKISAKDEARFWSKVRKTPGCWEWAASKNNSGYGCFSFNSKRWGAHRFSWLIHHGDSKGLFVLHSCDNRSCVNPSHLWVGTQSANLQDMIKKKRHRGVTHPNSYATGSRHHNAKLTTAKVKQIRALRFEGLSYYQIAKQFEVSRQHIRTLCLRKSWRRVK